jgi:hypothetical protein
VVDTVPPEITLNGDNPFVLTQGKPFIDPGATAIDSVDGDISAAIVIKGAVDNSVIDTFYLVYEAEDMTGNIAFETRAVIVVPRDLLSKYNVPAPAPIPDLDTVFSSITVDGAGPDLTAAIQCAITWTLKNSRLDRLELTLVQNGIVSVIDLLPFTTHSLNTAPPSLILAQTGIDGLDGEYYVSISEAAFVWVRTDGTFAIVMQ